MKSRFPYVILLKSDISIVTVYMNYVCESMKGVLMNQRLSTRAKRMPLIIWAGMSLPLTILSALTVILLSLAVPAICRAEKPAAAASLSAGDESISLTSCQITLSKDVYTYNGKTHTPSARITYEGTSLRKNRDFTVSYTNHIDAGTGRILITGTGKYTGTVSLPFTILPRKMAASYITLSGTSFTYEGKALTPDFTVTYQSLTRTAGKDFTCTYEDNINAGTAKLLVTGKGNFTGTAVKKFKITKADQILNVRSASDHLITGQSVSLTVTGYHGNVKFTSSSSGTAKVSAAAKSTDSPASCTVLAKKAGTVKIKVRASATDNYKAATVYLPLTVDKCSLEQCTASLSKEVYTYNGSAKKPSVRIFNPYTPSMKVTKSSGYTVTYKNCTAIGTASAVIKGTGSYTGTITLIYTIQPPKTSLYKPVYKDKQMTLKWRKITGITGYQIAISKSPDFDNQEILTFHSPSTVSASKSGLAENHTYYLRIRTYKTLSGKNYYSAWSKEKDISI